MTIPRVCAALAAACVSLLLALPASSSPDEANAAPLSSFPKEPIAIETRSAHRHTFQAWRAETPAQREQGLMFVKSMRADEAMIFVYDPAEYVAMWMKNTYIPLDMLFVDGHGCVITVKERAKPLTLDAIQPSGRVALVVELNAGIVADRGIRSGDRVVRPAANWPPQADAPCTVSR
jgi:uncharacterized membrane protein (UPF0127 family)